MNWWLVTVLCACACVSVNNATDQVVSSDTSLNKTGIRHEDQFSEGENSNSTIQNNQSYIGFPLESVELSDVDVNDQEIEGSERIARPVSFSYSTTHPAEVITVVHQHHPTQTARNVGRPRAHIPSYTLLPVLHGDNLPPLVTTVEVQKQQINVLEEDEPLQRLEEKDEVGGERESDDDYESEESYDEQGSDEEGEDYYDADYNEEEVEPRRQTQREKCLKFLKEYGTSLEDEMELDEGQSENIEHIVLKENLPIIKQNRSKKVHGAQKVLMSPMKFSYNEDSSPSASGHKNQHTDGKKEKGGGEEHDVELSSSHGKKEGKGYKGYHKYDKGLTGHHDKEASEKEYSDHKGKKGKHKDTEGHYGMHQQVQKGKKGATFEEKGKHKKGHSTKGQHNIHKKDEYVKKHEFYDEHHEGGDHEKHGGYHEVHAKKHGGKHKGGKKKAGYQDDHHGKKGHHQKESYQDEHKGHKESAGEGERHEHNEKYGKTEGHKKIDKWTFDNKE